MFKQIIIHIIYSWSRWHVFVVCDGRLYSMYLYSQLRYNKLELFLQHSRKHVFIMSFRSQFLGLIFQFELLLDNEMACFLKFWKMRVTETENRILIFSIQNLFWVFFSLNYFWNRLPNTILYQFVILVFL